LSIIKAALFPCWTNFFIIVDTLYIRWNFLASRNSRRFDTRLCCLRKLSSIHALSDRTVY
jgi:hypothetical protein